jgi:hypothetical protein
LFYLTPITGTNDILEDAMVRYRDIIFRQKSTKPPANCPVIYSTNITIALASLSTVLNGQTSERYNLTMSIHDGTQNSKNFFIHALLTHRRDRC